MINNLFTVRKFYDRHVITDRSYNLLISVIPNEADIRIKAKIDQMKANPEYYQYLEILILTVTYEADQIQHATLECPTWEGMEELLIIRDQQELAEINEFVVNNRP